MKAYVGPAPRLREASADTGPCAVTVSRETASAPETTGGRGRAGVLGEVQRSVRVICRDGSSPEPDSNVANPYTQCCAGIGPCVRPSHTSVLTLPTWQGPGPRETSKGRSYSARCDLVEPVGGCTTRAKDREVRVFHVKHPPRRAEWSAERPEVAQVGGLWTGGRCGHGRAGDFV